MPQERTTRVPIYVTQAELEQIRVNAARAGLSMSEWGRRQLLEEPMSEEQGEYADGMTEGDATRYARSRRLWVRRLASQALEQADGDRAVAELVLTEALLLLKQGFKP